MYGFFCLPPPAFAAKSLSIPIFLHDGNARLGKANKFLSRYAKALALSFPSPDAAKCHCPAIFTGMPLRKELKENISLSKEKAIDFINEKYGSAFTHTDPILLAFGGSLGAASLNKAVLQLLTLPGAEKLQFIHLAGKGKVQALEEAYASFKGKKLLLESNLSIKEISEKLCFDTPNYFTKTFKKVTNKTPTEYKKHAKF